MHDARDDYFKLLKEKNATGGVFLIGLIQITMITLTMMMMMMMVLILWYMKSMKQINTLPLAKRVSKE